MLATRLFIYLDQQFGAGRNLSYPIVHWECNKEKGIVLFYALLVVDHSESEKSTQWSFFSEMAIPETQRLSSSSE